MDSRYDNLRAWLLCAPATVAMVALNLVPACRELIDDPPRPLMAELTSWAISFLVILAQSFGLCGAILLVEVPVAFALAVALVGRGEGKNDGPLPTSTLLAAAVAGFAWRLLFGGSIGFPPNAPPGWATAAFEAWRTLPLATLLLYAALHGRAGGLGDAAVLDGLGSAKTLRRVYLPLCRPAIAALALFHMIDYLRTAHSPLLSVGSADRAIWTLLLLLVAIAALRVAAPRGASQ